MQTIKKRDKAASKQALLDAAIAVFSERGYDAATTKEVAKRAGVSEALITRYFEGKKGLLLEIVKSFSQEMPEDTPASLPWTKDLKEELKQLFAFHCRQHETNAAFMKVVLSRAIVDPELGKQVGAIVHNRKLPVLQTRLRHYLENSDPSQSEAIEALAFAVSSLSFSLGFMAPEVMSLETEKLHQITDQLCELLAKGMSHKVLKI